VQTNGELVKEVPFTASDTDSDGLYDSIGWTVPSLSNETYVIDLTLLNVYSHPVLGGNWAVGFNTSGTANLTVTATLDSDYTLVPTRWSDSSNDGSLYDLKFLSLTCGSDSVPYAWQGSSCDLNECSVFVENYSCNDTSYLTSLELAARKHVLLFLVW